MLLRAFCPAGSMNSISWSTVGLKVFFWCFCGTVKQRRPAGFSSVMTWRYFRFTNVKKTNKKKTCNKPELLGFMRTDTEMSFLEFSRSNLGWDTFSVLIPKFVRFACQGFLLIKITRGKSWNIQNSVKWIEMFWDEPPSEIQWSPLNHGCDALCADQEVIGSFNTQQTNLPYFLDVVDDRPPADASFPWQRFGSKLHFQFVLLCLDSSLR